jgi:hypothetical protein
MAKSPTRPPAVDVRRADQRFHTRIGWLDSHHSFSHSRAGLASSRPPRVRAR